jgi:TolB-like protein
VSAVHAAGLLHRDIKTHNVMQAQDGRIVLMDFGTGRELEDDLSSDLAGTPLYLAPEVLAGQQATVRSDIYSLGVVLYRLATGSYPVHARTVRGVRRAHERGERTAVQTARRDVPPKLARVIERAIDPRPERRYESADALAADLAALKPRPGIVRLTYAAGAAAAFILVLGAGWEVVGRQTGSFRTPSAVFAGFAGLSPVSVVDVSPAERPVIAVLPWKNLSAEPDSDYFVDGLTDEIIRNLAVIEGLEVRSSTSSFAFKDKPRNLRNIGEQLGANLVVEGSVLRAGSRLRINAQLVQVAGDIPLWAERFDREMKDVFAIQDEISRAIVNELRLTLGKGQRRYDTNLEAYELYLKARALVDRRGVVNARTAAKLFGQVIARDSAFAPAHAGLANAYALMSTPFGGIPFETAYPIMRPAAVKALQLDPLLAEAHAAMGWVYAYERDWANAEKAFQRAIELNPSLTYIYTSYSISTLEPQGKHQDALRLLQTASRHDPLSLDVQREIGRLQFSAGRYQEAIETFRRVYAIDPDFPFVSEYLARALMMAGRPSEVSSLKNTGPMVMALVYVRTGQRAAAEKLVAVMGNPYTEAIVYAVMVDKERTFGALERVANSAPQRLGRLLMSPEMRVLRGDPRVVALRKKFGLP